MHLPGITASAWCFKWPQQRLNGAETSRSVEPRPRHRSVTRIHAVLFKPLGFGVVYSAALDNQACPKLHSVPHSPAFFSSLLSSRLLHAIRKPFSNLLHHQNCPPAPDLTPNSLPRPSFSYRFQTLLLSLQVEVQRSSALRMLF